MGAELHVAALRWYSIGQMARLDSSRTRNKLQPRVTVLPLQVPFNASGQGSHCAMRYHRILAHAVGPNRPENVLRLCPFSTASGINL
jgi:hypothetical protein